MDNYYFDILVVDDHPIVRAGIKHIIETSGEMRVCGETGDGNQVLGLISNCNPDAVVLDLTIEGIDGLSLIGQIKARHPQLPVLILSMHDESLYAERCIRAGSKGYLMKTKASHELIRALHTVIGEGIFVSEAVKEQIVQSVAHSKTIPVYSIESLSPREFQVFRLYGEGLNGKTIADKLGCSPKTIETYCLRIRHKLGLHSLGELTAKAGSYFGSSVKKVIPRNNI